MSWYKVELTENQVAWEDTMERLQDQFGDTFLEAGSPADAAMFEQDGEGDASSVLYFSPAAASLASSLLQEYYAKPCEKPTGEDIGLLVGVDGAFSLLQ